jgi:hypothetical protein
MGGFPKFWKDWEEFATFISVYSEVEIWWTTEDFVYISV